ncbi:MAG: hypothetical protein ORO03_03765, partial [Alphaproteobacteria bacterium]|nr:hypothetical protein [Alphaproteobacteria bacterium]
MAAQAGFRITTTAKQVFFNGDTDAPGLNTIRLDLTDFAGRFYRTIFHNGESAVLSGVDTPLSTVKPSWVRGGGATAKNAVVADHELVFSGLVDDQFMPVTIADYGLDFVKAGSIIFEDSQTSFSNGLTIEAKEKIVFLHGVAVKGDGSLLLRSGGEITQAGGGITANNLTILAGGAVTLDGANSISTLKTVIAGGSVVIKSDPTQSMTLSGDLDTGGNSLALAAGSLVLGGNIFVQAKRLVLNNAAGELDAKGFTLDAQGAELTYSGGVIKSDAVVGKYAIELGNGSFTRRFYIANAAVVTIDSVGFRVGTGASQTLTPFLFGPSANGVGGIRTSGTIATEIAVSGKLIVEGNGSGGISDLARLTGATVDLSAGMATTTPLTIVASDPLGLGIRLLGNVSAGDFSLLSLAGIVQTTGTLTTTRLNVFARETAGLDQAGNSFGTVGTVNQPFQLGETLFTVRSADRGLLSLTTAGTMRLDRAIQGRVSLNAPTVIVTRNIEVNGSNSLVTFNV